MVSHVCSDYNINRFSSPCVCAGNAAFFDVLVFWRMSFHASYLTATSSTARDKVLERKQAWTTNNNTVRYTKIGWASGGRTLGQHRMDQPTT